MLRLLLILPLFQFQSIGFAACQELLNHELKPLGGGQPQRLCETHADKVVLVVNTASKCGYTYQYDDLEKLYERYRDQGLDVVGLPSNDFGGQEPGSEQQIKAFCHLNFGVSFPMYQKISAAKESAHPLIRGLAEAGGGYPQWNFHKYLINRDGELHP